MPLTDEERDALREIAEQIRDSVLRLLSLQQRITDLLGVPRCVWCGRELEGRKRRFCDTRCRNAASAAAFRDRHRAD